MSLWRFVRNRNITCISLESVVCQWFCKYTFSNWLVAILKPHPSGGCLRSLYDLKRCCFLSENKHSLKTEFKTWKSIACKLFFYIYFNIRSNALIPNSYRIVSRCTVLPEQEPKSRNMGDAMRDTNNLLMHFLIWIQDGPSNHSP